MLEFELLFQKIYSIRIRLFLKSILRHYKFTTVNLYIYKNQMISKVSRQAYLNSQLYTPKHQFKTPYTRPRSDPKTKDDAMLQIDCTFLGLKQYVVVLMGSSRIGKSTIADLFAAKVLLGTQDESGQIIYEAQADDGLKTKGHLVSCTTVLNRRDFGQISVLDLAGFMESRGEKQILAVVYNIKKLFETGKKIKFLLAVGQNEATSSLAKDRYRPFINFLKLFKNQLNDQDFIKQIYKATEIIVTKTTRTKQNIQKVLNGSVKGLQDPKVNIDYKNQLQQFLSYIVNENRFDIFPLAIEGNFAAPLQLKQKQSCEKHIWKILGLALSINVQKYGSIITIKFDAQNNLKMSCAIQLTSILKQIIKNCLSDNNYYKDAIDHQNIRKLLKDHLQKYDFYTTPHPEYVEFITKQSQTADQFDNVKPKTGLQLMKLLKEVYTISSQSQFNEEKRFEDLYISFENILQKFKEIFCSKRQDEKLFMNSSFIHLRGIIQVSQLCQISLQLGSMFPLAITQQRGSIFSQNIIHDQMSFVKNMTKQIHQRLFDTLTKEEQYRQFIDTLIRDLQTKQLKTVSNSEITNFKLIQINNSINGVDKLIHLHLFDKAINLLLETYNKYENYTVSLLKEVEQNKNIQFNIKENENLKISILKKIAICLSSIGNKKLALEFFCKINFPLSTIQCKRQLMTQCESIQTLVDSLIDLADYCLKVGKRQLALVNYYQALQKSTNVKQRQTILTKLKNIDTIKTIDLMDVFDKTIEVPVDLISRTKEFILDYKTKSSSGSQTQ